MKWFEGSINEAVVASKAKKAIFVVFIDGKDDASVTVSEVIESSEISSRLEQEDFVTVRIESGSENYRFFAQIYQLVPVPSVFFIGETGVPLEIVAGNFSIPELSSKIDDILVKSGKNASGSSASFIQSEQRATATGSVNITTEKSTSNKQEGLVQENEENATESTNKEKLMRAQQLMDLQKKQRVQEEIKKEKERELERRKRERELEMKQSQEERLKERAADDAARERVRKQIAEDRLMQKEKEQAFQKNTSQQQPVKEVVNKSLASSSSISVVRIQFRLPSGSTHMGQFEPSVTLGALRDYVLANIELPFQQFVMSTSFPRRNLLSEDDDKNLMDLELVPTSVILILPLKNANGKSVFPSSDDLGILSRIIWSVFTPIIGIYNYVMQYFHGADRSQGDDAAGTRESANTANENNSRTVPRNQNPVGLHRRSNIHRLHSVRDDDDDENNTWNGNSTQQM